MRIAVDAMGGDLAPQAPVHGAVWAAREFGCPVVLVGQEAAIRHALSEVEDVPAELIEICDAPEFIEMDEPAAAAFKKKKGSSIRVAFNLVKEGKVHGVVSAGNSGAIMTGAALVLGRTVGVDRPAIAGVFPSLSGPIVVIDVGANVNCKPRHLFQFAIMGDIYARSVLHIENPQVGLLSIGEESSKGNELVKHVHELLRNTNLNFIGNVEGRDIFSGKAQVIICDGFVGNVCLKLTEGLGQVFKIMLVEEAKKEWMSRLGFFFARGVNGAGIVCHGSSPAKAIKNAVRAAREVVQNRVNEHLARGLARFSQEEMSSQPEKGEGVS
ncbi:MAG: phosphate acyltransferase PlsX [Deltaproteobacteria bacterium]|nr:phosphate acyltransferase PlsX [Deltaproteobacteria bacterium]